MILYLMHISIDELYKSIMYQLHIRAKNLVERPGYHSLLQAHLQVVTKDTLESVGGVTQMGEPLLATDKVYSREDTNYCLMKTSFNHTSHQLNKKPFQLRLLLFQHFIPFDPSHVPVDNRQSSSSSPSIADKKEEHRQVLRAAAIREHCQSYIKNCSFQNLEDYFNDSNISQDKNIVFVCSLVSAPVYVYSKKPFKIN
jgi:hypothetical protein